MTEISVAIKHILNKYIFLCVGIFLNINSNVQSASISGIITAYKNKMPVKGVHVSLNPGSYTDSTNQQGEYHIKNVKQGEYFLTIMHMGYKPISRKLKIYDKDIYLNFTLDSVIVTLKEVTINGEDDNSFGINRLKSIEGTAIYAGKKSEVIKMDDISANLATNNSRQIYSKIPGLNIWESDGAGIQLGIGGRGLSPNRTSNFNTRQNGYDMSADALGYPESYYTPPAEAVDRIEILRGAASLQYGTQFGGMINFKLKNGNEDKKIQMISRQTLGSFGFYNTFNSIGGSNKKWNYYICYQFKKGDGWRPNSHFNSHTAHSVITYSPHQHLSFTLEYTCTNYLAQQAGGLTDQMFLNNPRQSIRSRNWFKVNWNLAAFIINYKLNDRTTINIRNFGLLAERDALGYLGSINRADPMKERDLLQDQYKNFGNETRFIHKYNIREKNAVFLIGERYYQGLTLRKQGDGSSASDADFKYVNPDNLESSNYNFPSRNLSFFSENIFYITPKFSIIPGIRYERIFTAAQGYYKETLRDLAGNIIFSNKSVENKSNSRSFVLAGVGLSYRHSEKFELYGNYSQNYRAINFNDMRVVNPSLKVDPNLIDEHGFSSDLGVRGKMRQIFNYDISIFLINYNNRIGSVLRVDSSVYNVYRFRTNISDSRNYGIESFLELDVWKMFFGKEAKNSISIFTNLAWLDARYIHSSEPAYNNKKVELVPSLFIKTGITYKRKNMKATCQYAYTSEQFTDATNSLQATNAVNGIIPAYYVMDFSVEYRIKRFTCAGGINNITNNMYFTRRAESYPGPGIIPSDGRSFYLTLAIKL